MIQIIQIDSVDETAFDHVKCPQCGTRLCGKPKDSKVHILRLSRRISTKTVPLLHTCKRCGNHYLISTESE
jgi:hypothetical protein